MLAVQNCLIRFLIVYSQNTGWCQKEHDKRKTMPKHKFCTNEQVFGKPKHVFKNPGRVPQYKPEPVSISTRNTGLPPSQNRNQSISDLLIQRTLFSKNYSTLIY